MSTDGDKIVGHKTFSDGRGGFRHEPLTKREGDELWARVEAAREKRAADMPDDRAALHALGQAYQRLEELGWSNAIYCPKDGTPFDVIEAGSTGIHDCSYSGEWPNGHWWIAEDGDLSPSRPILFRLRPAEKAKEDARRAESMARYAAENPETAS